MTAQRHRLKNFVAATLAATMLAGSCISTGEANATPIFDDTPLGPFFNVSQAKLDSVPNGTLIRIRPVSNFVVQGTQAVSYTHLRAHETEADLVCRLLLWCRAPVSYTHLTLPTIYSV